MGANLAAPLLKRHGVDGGAAREAWLAIAMHTSPHVAEGAGGLVTALRLGVERELGDAVVRQIVAVSSKAPSGSWPCDLLRAKEAEPEWG